MCREVVFRVIEPCIALYKLSYESQRPWWHSIQAAARTMLVLAHQLSGGRSVALAITRHAWKSGISPQPLLRATQAAGLILGQDDFRALLEDASLLEEQVFTCSRYSTRSYTRQRVQASCCRLGPTTEGAQSLQMDSNATAGRLDI